MTEDEAVAGAPAGGDGLGACDVYISQFPTAGGWAFVEQLESRLQTLFPELVVQTGVFNDEPAGSAMLQSGPGYGKLCNSLVVVLILRSPADGEPLPEASLLQPQLLQAQQLVLPVLLGMDAASAKTLGSQLLAESSAAQGMWDSAVDHQEQHGYTGPQLVAYIIKRCASWLAAAGKLPLEKDQPLPQITTSALHSKAADLVKAARGAAAENRLLLLHGAAGSGKTTLVTASFNLLHQEDRTVRCCFVRLHADQVAENALVPVQQQLLSELGSMAQPDVKHEESGRKQLAALLKGKRVLLVLDNVWGKRPLVDGAWSKAQLERLLPVNLHRILGPGSIVLVTSRDADACSAFQHVLTEHDLMPAAEAMELLCQQAYGCNSAPDQELQQQLQQLVDRCGRLPLALEVVGQQLRTGQDAQDFVKHMDESLAFVYQSCRAGRLDRQQTVFGALQASWSVLTDEQQDLLLDLGWFFNGLPLELLQHCCTQPDRLRLQQLGLLDLEGPGGQERVAVHSVVVDFCKLAVGCSRNMFELHFQSDDEDVAGMAMAVVDSGKESQDQVADVRGLVLNVPLVNMDVLAGFGSPQWQRLRALQVNEEEHHAGPERALQLCMKGLKYLRITSAASGTALPTFAAPSLPISYSRLMHPNGVPGLELTGMPELALLALEGVKGLQSLLVDNSCSGLRAVLVDGCAELLQIDVQGVASLQQLDVRQCSSLAAVWVLQHSKVRSDEKGFIRLPGVASVILKSPVPGQFAQWVKEVLARRATKKNRVELLRPQDLLAEALPALEPVPQASTSAAGPSGSGTSRTERPQAAAADDASTDETREMLRTWAEDLRTVRQARSEGYPPYDVFISYSGEMKHTFVSVLKEHFPSHCRTFADAWDLLHGVNSSYEMIKACGTTRVGVVIISPESVAKKWPMRELHILVDRHRRGEVGLVPLLWFDDFKDFEVIVKGYQQCHGQRRLWASLLSYLCKTGMVVKGVLTAQRSLHEVADEVVAAVLRLLRQAPAGAGGGQRPVGFEEQLETLLEVVRGGKAVWLHGMGGSGKTRMVTQLRRDLEAVGLVRRVAVLELEFTAGSGPTKSQEEALQLLKRALRDLDGRDCGGASLSQVREWFAEAATRPATLVVVDNVHSQEQIGLLLGEPLRLDRVPFLVFTSRLQQPTGGTVLADVWTQVQRRLHRHAVAGLPGKDALQLFRSHCKRPANVAEEVEEHVVQRCGGLPLALLIVAGVLTGQEDTAAWMAAAQAMVESGEPASEVAAESEFGLQRIMQHSLLGLRPAALDMFLDTACVLAGQPEDRARAAWGVWHGRKQAAASLQQLKNRNLLTADDKGHLWVHDVLRWFGRRVVRGEVELGGRNYRGTRLWVQDGRLEPQARAGEVFNVLVAERHPDSLDGEQAGLGSAGGALDFSQARIVLKLKLRAANTGVQSLLWCDMSCGDAADADLGSVISLNTQLCILRLYGCGILPNSLVELSYLQRLDLSGCWKLPVLPESLGQLSSLQQLYLTGCKTLTGVPGSLAQLASLQELDLSGCSGLTVLPESLGQLSSLHRLVLGGCERLIALPESLGQLSCLHELDLSRCKELTELPESMGWLSLLQMLGLNGCEGLQVLPDSLGQACSLQQLDIRGCMMLIVLPDSIGQLTSLQQLDMRGCMGLTALPDSLGQLPSLHHLDLSGCINLTALPNFMQSSMEQLHLAECERLATLPNSLGQMSCLQQLSLRGCERLITLPNSLGQLVSLQVLNLGGCQWLNTLPDSLEQLSSLQTLGLNGCEGLTSLPYSLGHLFSLQQLRLSWCARLTSLPETLGQLSSLQRLDLRGCKALTELPDSLGHLSSLEWLDMSSCTGLTKLPDSLGLLSCLQQLGLSGCIGITQLPKSAVRLTSLCSLGLENSGLAADHPSLAWFSGTLQRPVPELSWSSKHDSTFAGALHG